MVDNIFHFNIGSFKCACIQDGALKSTPDFAFSTAHRKELEKILKEYDIAFSRIVAPLTCLLINTTRHRVLIDTGLGSENHPYAGMLEKNLQQMGISPEDIDIVLLTHGHLDHIGGNTDQNGKPVFINATHVIMKEEWDYWTSEAVLARQNITWAAFARKNLPPLKDQIRLVRKKETIIPGVTALPAPGHTPGHMAILITSDNNHLLTIGDAAGHPIHCLHPEWSIASDTFQDQAIKTRKDLFELASAGNTLLYSCHFPFPGIGHVVKQKNCWNWEPLDVNIEPIRKTETK